VQSGEDMPSLRKGTALLGQRMAKGAKPPFDITARAFEFALMVVEFAGRLPTGMAERYLAHQLIKSGTAIGTNVEEGDVAESTRNLAHKLSIAQRGQRVEVLVSSNWRNRHW